MNSAPADAGLLKKKKKNSKCSNLSKRGREHGSKPTLMACLDGGGKEEEWRRVE